MSKKLTQQEFEGRLSGRWIVESKYIDTNTPVKVRCHKCGESFVKKPCRILYNDTHCRNCYLNSKFVDNEIISDFGNTLVVDISTPSNPGVEMIIDKEDYKEIKEKYSGRILARKTHQLYAVTKHNGKMLLIHRLIVPEAKIIDHINHNGLDNRKLNLRPCTHSENMRNRVLQKNNTSGTPGVRKLGDKWYAKVSNGKGKAIGLGGYASKDEAIAARRGAEAIYYKEFRKV